MLDAVSTQIVTVCKTDDIEMKNKEETACEQPNVHVVRDCEQNAFDAVIRSIARF